MSMSVRLPKVIYLLCNYITLENIFCIFDTTMFHPSIQKEPVEGRNERRFLIAKQGREGRSRRGFKDKLAKGDLFVVCLLLKTEVQGTYILNTFKTLKDKTLERVWILFKTLICRYAACTRDY